MKNNKKLTERLNVAISNMGPAMGPSLTNLILYGPIEAGSITANNRDILEYNTTLFKKIYDGQIFPKVGKIFHTLTQSNCSFSGNRKELNRLFRKRSPKSIRKKLRDSYKGQFELDSITAQSLFSEEEISNKYYDGLKYHFNSGSRFMISKRYKSIDEIKKKYKIAFDTLSKREEDNFLRFLVDISENDYTSWDKHNYYLNKYGEHTLNMMLGDFFGAKIVDMNQKHAEFNMERLVSIGPKINFHQFSVVNGRFKDHRERNKKYRPGGIHYTLVDKALPNYPIEVQFRTIKDECLNLFGENAHYLYGLNGKKANSKLHK